jgi:hypothetical protein
LNDIVITWYMALNVCNSMDNHNKTSNITCNHFLVPVRPIPPTQLSHVSYISPINPHIWKTCTHMTMNIDIGFLMPLDVRNKGHMVTHTNSQHFGVKSIITYNMFWHVTCEKWPPGMTYEKHQNTCSCYDIYMEMKHKSWQDTWKHIRHENHTGRGGRTHDIWWLSTNLTLKMT